MQRHAPSVIRLLRKDRHSGMSIRELMEKYSLPKTTVWHHIQDIELSAEIKGILRSRMGNSHLRSKLEWQKAERNAGVLLKDFDEKDAWPILMAALYWGEGTKKSGFVFTNTDGSMIQVFLKFLRTRLAVKDEELDILIRTCAPMRPIVCKKYWARIAGVSVDTIRINHNATHNKSKSAYGMCRITLRKGGYKLKLMHCLINEIVTKVV